MAASVRRVASWLLSSSIFLWVGIDSWAQPPSEPAIPKPQVLYLHTEFLPYQRRDAKDLPYRLSREMIRQALLVSARDELGLLTCDETLQETPPDGADVVHLILTERSNLNGKWHLKLSAFDEGQDLDAAHSLWEKTYDYEASGTKMYADMVPKLEIDTRGAFVEALMAAGLRGAKPAQKDQALPSAEVDQLLLKPDFIAQFGAVRAAHQAIAANGETPEWLSVLTRGYGNLATLTHHHWNSATEVFAARSWLYSQRMVAADGQSAFALWNRAYAWALGGAFHHSLADIERIEKLRANADRDTPPDDPQWTKLIKPYTSSNRAEIKQVGEDNKELKLWSTCLWFELSNFTRYPEWMYEAGGEVGRICPTAYGVFSEMAHHGRLLGVVRTGANIAPRAFGRFAPESLDSVPGMPNELRDLLPTDEAKRASLGTIFNDPNPDDSFSAVPGFIAAKLRERSRKQAEGDLSWSALASLLEEEQFVEAAHYLNVATNATESSLKDEVDSLLPLVKHHRYAPYVESFYLNRSREPEQLRKLVGNMSIRDPRFNMSPMFSRVGLVPNAQGQPIGKTARDNAYRDFTMPGMVESLFAYGPEPVRYDARFDRMFANEVSAIAPGSEIGTRMSIQAARNPNANELKDWESQLKEDALGFSTLAQHYVKLGDNESTVRCLEKSLASLPTVDATIQLADIYRKQGDRTKWEQSLLAFLKTEDLGLQRARVHQQLANGFSNQGKWKKAKPHALAAGETWSGSGLNIASHVCEGLAEWGESERWIRELSTSYPSYSGDAWYFWCRRTGRGDLKQAEALARQFFSVPAANPTWLSHMRRGAYHVLIGDLQTARDSYHEALKLKPSFTSTCMVAQLSRELKDEPLRSEVIAAMAKEVANPKGDTPRIPIVDEAGLLVLDLMKNGNPSSDRLAKIEESLMRLGDDDRNTRAALAYYLGTELESLGQDKEAEKYWRRSLIEPSYDPDLATMAGAKLAKLHGTSRPDDDVLDEEDLWPPFKPKP